MECRGRMMISTATKRSTTVAQALATVVEMQEKA
eukprot:CAMPEP_0197920176 /NCGR_PEP_ID=MMETSP1439-20131203/88501_1 /TAXON_ID=66791 /ORGANISM="Gonyaulax spinifera, Strain CCMP409" /LENGTH=33 /DNA_ID= /DNA_START= /DNA_END= /DNA_ORIENTATION=